MVANQYNNNDPNVVNDLDRVGPGSDVWLLYGRNVIEGWCISTVGKLVIIPIRKYDVA